MRKLKMFVISMIALALLSPALFAAGGGDKSKDGTSVAKEGTASAPLKVNLTFWTNAATNRAWLEEMARRYDKVNGTVDFTLEVTQFPGGELAQKIIGSFISKSGIPDLAAIQTPDLAKYLKGGFAKNNLYDLKSLLKDVSFEDLMYAEQWMWEGTQYALNMDTSISVYYYRKDIMDSVGIDPNTWKTWDDYIRDGLKLKKEKDVFISVQDIAGWNQYMIFMYMNRGGLFDKNGNNVMNSKENAEALQLWVDLVNKYKINWPTTTFYGPGTTEAQREGKVAGVIIPEWYHAQYLLKQLPDQTGKWRMAVLPAFAPGKPRTAHRGGTALAVTKSTKYPEVAADFIKFCFFSVENRRETYMMPEMGQFPSYRPSLTDQTLLNFEFPYFGNQKTAKLLAEAAAEIPPYYAHPFLAEAFDLLNRKVLPVVLDGSKTPQVALNEAKVELDKIMGK